MSQRKKRSQKEKSARETSAEEASQLKLDLNTIKQEHADVDTQAYTEDDLIPSGSPMLNLACSGYVSGAYKKGSINTVPGVSDAGKTVLCMTGLASAASDKRFDKWDLIMNNAEVKGSFDIPRMFPPLSGRLKEPAGGPSKTIHQFGGSIIEQCKSKTPFIEILDSLDTLKGDADFEKSIEKALKVASGDIKAIKEIKKSFNAEKAKTIRKILGECNDMLSGSDSVLIIVQQLTMNMNKKGPYDDPYTSNGGTAPFFNSTHSFRLLQGGKITKTISGKKLEIGNIAKMVCRKNHLNGCKRNINFPIYSEFGIDNIESMCQFLAEFWWKSSAESITPATMIAANEFQKTQIKFRDLVDMMWEDPAKNTQILKKISEEAWKKREEALTTGRRAIF